MTLGGRTRYHARWILPITAPPIPHGWVEVAGGTVAAVGGPAAARARPPAPDVDLGRVAVLPGLVNAHTHLELSPYRGAVPPADTMPAWAAALMRRVAAGPPPGAAAAIRAAVADLRRAGTALVGDVANTLAAVPALDAGRVDAVVFREAIGFDVRPAAAAAAADRLARQMPGRVRARVRFRAAAHAPYSVSPALCRALAARLPGPRSVHLAESREELALLRDGAGAWRGVLEARGRWPRGWRPPGFGPVAWLDAVGWLRRDTLVVHGVQLTPAEIARVAAAGATIVACPRSNRWTGAGVPPVAAFYAAGAKVAIGTDSLASAPDLQPFAELAALRRLAPGVPARRLLRSATLTGAAALGRARTHGAITASRRAALIAVTVSGTVANVEEYLVRGIAPEQIAWIDAQAGGAGAPAPRRARQEPAGP